MITESYQQRDAARRPGSRHGAALLELIVAGSVLAVTMTFVLPILGRVAMARRDVVRHEAALRVVRNTVEELLAGTKTPAQVDLPQHAREQFEEASLTVEPVVAMERDKTGGAAPYRVRLSWQHGHDDDTRDVSLLFWMGTAGGEQ